VECCQAKGQVGAWLSESSQAALKQSDQVEGLVTALKALKKKVHLWHSPVFVLSNDQSKFHVELEYLEIKDRKVRLRLCLILRQLLSADYIYGVLYKLIIHPVSHALKVATELLIIPHSDLLEVPWAALINPKGKYLIRDYAIRVAPFLSAAHAAAKDVVAGASVVARRKVVVVGNPMPTHLISLPVMMGGALVVARTICKSKWDQNDEVLTLKACDLALPLANSHRKGISEVRLLTEESASTSVTICRMW